MHTNIRSSHPEVFCEKDVLKNFSKLTENDLCLGLFLMELQSSGCFPMNFDKYLRILFLKNTSGGCFLNMFSFELSSVISKVFVADFEHVFVCWGKYRITIAVLPIIQKTYPTNKSLLIVNSRNPKARCEIWVKLTRDCISLLTTCNMSKTFFKCFSVALWTSLCLEQVFLDVFIVNFKVARVGSIKMGFMDWPSL